MSEKTAEPFSAVQSTPLLASGGDPEFKGVRDFLQRFGYLPDGALPLDTDEAEMETAALRLYQERQGLEPTGVFDEQTKAQMSTHRCGLPDLASGVAFSTRCSWPNPNLTFAFEDGTNDTGAATEFQAVRDAFTTWSAAAPLTFTEVASTQNPDIAIDWRPAADPDHSMVGGVLAHADFPPACGVVTNALPKPVHFDDSEHLWSIGAAANAFDVETVALHELGHILGLQHSSVNGSVMFASVASNSTKQALTADDLDGIRQLYPAGVLAAGTYTIRQKSNNRFLDAHEIADKDFRLVTRTAQNNNTQLWELAVVGAVFTIRQKSNGRFVDAHDTSANDFRTVTRSAQDDDSQRWVRLPSSGGTFTFRQLSTGRYLDAHEGSDKDFQLVTRPAQNNDSQRWLCDAAGANTFTIRQKSTNRFVDAHEISSKDFSVVTRTAQNDDTQRWVFGQVGAVYTIRQKSNSRFVDAHEVATKDFAAVTRTAQNDDTQRWVVLPTADGSFTVRQLSSRRFLDAHVAAAQDFSVVTRTAQNDDTQRWLFTKT